MTQRTAEDQAIINACSNEPKTVHEIAAIVGRSWVVVLSDLNRLTRAKVLVRDKQWGQSSRWSRRTKP